MDVYAHVQWRIQDFRVGGVEVLQAPMGWGVGRGYPLTTEGRVWGGGFPQKIFRIILKIPYFEAF